MKHGRVVAEEDLPDIDFLLCGSVAVNLSGARIGKGGGFSDLEYGLLIHAGKIDDHTTVATTVHPIQILREHLQMHRSRSPGRSRRHAARGDRARASVPAAARDPLGPPAAAADPGDPDPGADGVRVSAVDQIADDHPVRDELRRIASDTAYVMKLARGKVELPPPTPADGPDPYGNPDPEWLRIDWAEHLTRSTSSEPERTM